MNVSLCDWNTTWLAAGNRLRIGILLYSSDAMSIRSEITKKNCLPEAPPLGSDSVIDPYNVTIHTAGYNYSFQQKMSIRRTVNVH